MERPMLTAILVASLAGIVAGGGLVLGVQSGQRASKHDAEIEQARTDALAAAATAGADAAREGLAPELARVDALAEQASRLPAYCEDGQLYDEAACMAWAVCTRAGLTQDGGQAVGCDRALNAWESERQIEVIEADEADAARREERRRTYERRK
jgi:hypothetical protein